VSIVVHSEPEIVRAYLTKQDRTALQRHETDLYRTLFRAASRVAEALRTAGYEAVATEPNLDCRYKRRLAYRLPPHPVRQRLVDWLSADSPSFAVLQVVKQGLTPVVRRAFHTPSWRLTPTFSHRYGAVAAGLGSLGWSGNVLHPDHGARVLFNTVVTSADLRPASDSVEQTPSQTPCDRCRLCVQANRGSCTPGRAIT